MFLLNLLLIVACLIHSNVGKPIGNGSNGSQTNGDNNNQTTSCTIDANYRQMSTKTSYDEVANVTNFDNYVMPNCKQIGVWILTRHGGRYPERKEIIEMKSTLKNLKHEILSMKHNKYLCKKDLEKLDDWKFNMKPDDDYNLTKRGREIMRKFGSRMRKRLQEVLNQDAKTNSRRINAQTTSIVRTVQSAEEFFSGMFKDSEEKPTIQINSKEDDYLLKFPDLCSRFIQMTDKNSSYCPEYDEFVAKSKDLKQIQRVFFQRLGIEIPEKDQKKTFSNVLKTCQYEYLINGKTSIWCRFFDRKALKTLEYQEDIKYNCKYSYKYNISRDMACDLLKNLSDSLTNYKTIFEKKDTNSTNMNVFFSHSSGILPFLANFGIGKSEDNFNVTNILAENEARKYRISRLDPMNSNIVFVLFACKNGTNNQTSYKLRAFHNENLIKLEPCVTTDCQLDEISSYLGSRISTCVSSRDVCDLK